MGLELFPDEQELQDLMDKISNEIFSELGIPIDDGWLEKEVENTELNMSLEDAYRHIKESYLHHKLERNAVFLPKAELMALMCIQKIIAENNKEISELPNIIDNGDKIDGYNYSYKTDSEGVPYINIDSVRAMLTKAANLVKYGM